MTKQSNNGAKPETNLYLVGFMGTGKSTIGRMVASRLGFKFLDSDAEIERARGKSVRKIFEQEGEDAFRRYERDFIVDGHPPQRCVVACGGGLITQPGMVDILKAKGVLIALYASPETIIERTSINRARPLLDCDNPEKRIRELMAAREAIYREAGSLVLTDHRSRCEVLAHIQRIYSREVRERGTRKLEE